MARRLCILVGLFMLFAGTASAQTVDVRKALEAAFSGAGFQPVGVGPCQD